MLNRECDKAIVAQRRKSVCNATVAGSILTRWNELLLIILIYFNLFTLATRHKRGVILRHSKSNASVGKNSVGNGERSVLTLSSR